MTRNALLLSRGWQQVGPRPGFNRPQHWCHPKLDGWYMTDKAIKIGAQL
jgi:hypothetical protein